MSDIDQFMSSARRSQGLPIIKFTGVDDGFQGTVTNRQIRDLPSADKDKPPVKTLIIELELTAPRTQEKLVKNETTGMLEPTTITGTAWSWFVKENSQALTELEQAMGPDKRPGSPLPGDQLRVKLIGLKATKHPKPQQIFKIQYKPAGAETQVAAAPAAVAPAPVRVPVSQPQPAIAAPAEQLVYGEDDLF